jgi:tRNA(fMet)-specific endonuclease VapC
VVATPGTNRPRGFLLGINIVVAVHKREEAVLGRLEDAAGSLLVPVIALGELRFGALNSVRIEENLQSIEGFAAEANVLPCDEDTARFYGEIKDGLRRKGRPIPENDIWIAATARRYDLTLVSRDSHFEHVENLQVERW